MKASSEVKWDEVVHRAIARTVEDIERMDAIARHSALVADDIDALDHRIKEGLRRRYESADGPQGPHTRP